MPNILDWDDARQAASIMLYLKGKPKACIEALQAGNRDTMTKIVAELKRNGVEQREVLMERFMARQKREDESPRQFAEAITALLEKAAPGMSADDKKVQLKAKLRTNLPPVMAQLIKMLPDQPWEQMVQSLDNNPTPQVELKSEPVEANVLSRRQYGTGDQRRLVGSGSNGGYRRACNACALHKQV